MKNHLIFRMLRGPQPRILIGFAILAIAGSAFIGHQIPLQISDLYSVFESDKFFEQAYLVLLQLFVAQYVLRVCYQFIVSLLVTIILRRTRKTIYSTFVNSQSTGQDGEEIFREGEVISRLMNDTEAIGELVTSGGLTIIIDFFFLVSSLAGFYSINTFYGHTLLIAEITVAIGLFFLSKIMAKFFMEVRVATARLTGALSNIIGGVGQLYFANHDRYPERRARASFDEFLKTQLKANLWDAGFYATAESLYPLLLALVVILFPHSGVARVAVIAALIDLIQRSIGPIKDMAGKIATIQRSLTGFKRLNEFVLKLDPQSLRRPTSPVLPQESSGKSSGKSSEESSASSSHENIFSTVKIDLPEFEYQSSGFRLEKISLTLERGKKTAIIGKSGCGKSTLLKILSGRVPAPALQISLDENQSISPEKLTEFLRSKTCLVAQSSHVFSESLVFNICFEANPNERFWKFWNFILEAVPYTQMWKGKEMETLEPVKVSLGQKQLISILRFCYFELPIVYFDEISSALDSNLEAALGRAMEEMQKHSAVLVVAHRLETIRDADEIILMEKGQIKVRGTHGQLLETEVYRESLEYLEGKN